LHERCRGAKWHAELASVEQLPFGYVHLDFRVIVSDRHRTAGSGVANATVNPPVPQPERSSEHEDDDEDNDAVHV
jgi:hypothetical protein